MKKLIAGSLMASMLIVPAMAQDVSVYLNNERMVFDQNPIIENGRTLVPLRSIFEGLGAEVKWNPDIQEIKGITSDREVVLRVGETSATVNGNTVTLDVPAKIENGRTLVPLRFISESLDAEVKWNADEYRIDIESVENEYEFLENKDNINFESIERATMLKAERLVKMIKVGILARDIPLTMDEAEKYGLKIDGKVLLGNATKENLEYVINIVGIDSLYISEEDLIDPLGKDIDEVKNYFRVYSDEVGNIFIVSSESAEEISGKIYIYAFNDDNFEDRDVGIESL